jgi:hypothetical protein
MGRFLGDDDWWKFLNGSGRREMASAKAIPRIRSIYTDLVAIGEQRADGNSKDDL